MAAAEQILTRISDRPFTVLVFFRGSWCPFCQGYLRELGGTFRKQVEHAGGALIAITSQLDQRVQADWELGFDVLSDPENTLALRFGAAITPKEQTPLAGHPTEYAHGMAQPAVVALDINGQVLYRWAIEPAETNLGGASDRPLPAFVWASIEAARQGRPLPAPEDARLDPDFLAAHYPALHKTFVDWVASMSA
jgi:peroxiredoxin